MRLLLPALLAIAAASPAAAAITTRSVIALPAPRAGWLVCDSVDSPFAALVGEVGGGGSDITLVTKPAGTATTRHYSVGPADPGAGQIYYALTRNGADAGNLHAVNPGLLDPSLPEPLNFTSISIDGHQLSCRLINHVRLMAVTARRGVTVTREAGRLVYRSYDFAHMGVVQHPDGVQQTNAASLRISGGSQTGSAGATTFRFLHNGYRYRLDLPAGNAAGRLTVTHGTHMVVSERLLGFTLVSG